MSAKGQISLLDDDFKTVRPSTPLFCHQEFLEKLATHNTDGIGRRAAFLMQRLSVDARRLHYKSTSGANRGWRRSRLGGNQGSHFYAWWAPANAIPLQGQPDFPKPEGGAIFLRDIRHHDDHAPLSPQTFIDNYLEVTVRDLRRSEYGPAPWTPPQARFASSRQTVRLLKGHPGSGKTTALWHAADSAAAERILYVTYSRDLAALARDYFDRFCSLHKHFDVVLFPDLVRRITGSDSPPAPDREALQRFTRDLVPFSRQLGAWTRSQSALFDEFHAHLVGDALPLQLGRFAACGMPRVPDSAFRDRRVRFLGAGAVNTALDIASRLERASGGTLAERYFPELNLAWHALLRLRDAGRLDPAVLDYDCIAVDECQDLTPMEASVVVQLANLINSRRRYGIPLLLAGDEAQTVRPTDFEWGWLSDLLHFQVGTPSEHKLGANLRSPRRLAVLVNEVWDLYSHVSRQDRPSGAGLAEIDDDAPDQLLYCTAAPGPDLNALFEALAAREGMALITLGEAAPDYVPESVRNAILTPREAKGLDFHSVCVIDAGRHLERIVEHEQRMRADSDIEGLRKRLAIDQLRVALSRATERLLWLDVNPTPRTVRLSTHFLNRDDSIASAIASAVPAAVMAVLGDEELDVEERVQRCLSDARQYLEVRPEMAWSRARQAVTLLGKTGTPGAVADEAVRDATLVTAAEVCFVLAMRGVELAPELGSPDLFGEARDQVALGHRLKVAGVIMMCNELAKAPKSDRMPRLAALATSIVTAREQLEPWLLIEIESRWKGWVDELDSSLSTGVPSMQLIEALPSLYTILHLPDAETRTSRARQRAVQALIKDRRFDEALEILANISDRQPKSEAICHEGLGDFKRAADCYAAAGIKKDALRCYRLVPDIPAALGIAREIADGATAESLEWIGKLRDLVDQRPEKFTKVVTPAEKKILEQLLEQALGVTRQKAAAKKAATKRAPATKKTATRKAAAPKPKTTRKPSVWDDDPLF